MKCKIIFLSLLLLGNFPFNLLAVSNCSLETQSSLEIANCEFLQFANKVLTQGPRTIENVKIYINPLHPLSLQDLNSPEAAPKLVLLISQELELSQCSRHYSYLDLSIGRNEPSYKFSLENYFLDFELFQALAGLERDEEREPPTFTSYSRSTIEVTSILSPTDALANKLLIKVIFGVDAVGRNYLDKQRLVQRINEACSFKY